jgi:hypothetical protein
MKATTGKLAVCVAAISNLSLSSLWTFGSAKYRRQLLELARSFVEATPLPGTQRRALDAPRLRLPVLAARALLAQPLRNSAMRSTLNTQERNSLNVDNSAPHLTRIIYLTRLKTLFEGTNAFYLYFPFRPILMSTVRPPTMSPSTPCTRIGAEDPTCFQRIPAQRISVCLSFSVGATATHRPAQKP